MESNRLDPSAETFEQSHAREKFTGARLHVVAKYKDDSHIF
jgi:hypothetical protein